MMDKTGQSSSKVTNGSTERGKMNKTDNGVTETEKTIMELWELKKAGDKSAKVIVLEKEMGIEGYIDINEAAVVLDRSVYRVRQLYWDKRLGVEKRVGKRIFLKRSEVEKYKIVQNSRKVRNSGLEKRRFGTRVVKSAETMMELVEYDKTIEAGLKRVIMELLRKYKNEGRKVEKEYSR